MSRSHAASRRLAVVFVGLACALIAAGAARVARAQDTREVKEPRLPAVCATLTASLLAQYTVIMRATLLDVLSEDYIVTGRAIGLSKSLVMRRHAVPNAMLPVITLLALNIGLVLSGAFVIESIFSWPGIGDLTINAIADKDYPMLQGAFLISSAAVIIANFGADILYGYLDPRVTDA